MKVLVACEYSGVVREAFRAKGHDAWSCDLLESDDNSPYHITGHIFDCMYNDWDLMIAHPPCTYLCSSGLHWNKKDPFRPYKTEEAIDFFYDLYYAPISKIALENPIGIMSTALRKPDQIIQPWMFGHDASKATCLWLKNLPVLEPTKFVEPRLVDGKKRWGNQTDSGQNRLGPSKDRWKIRSRTYEGIAQAMAEQWG